MKGEFKDGWIKWRKFTKQSEKSIFRMVNITMILKEKRVSINERGVFNEWFNIIRFGMYFSG